jgi:hypothetical protein
MCLACELDALWYGGFDLPAGPLRPGAAEPGAVEPGAVEPGTVDPQPPEPEPSLARAAGDPAAVNADGGATAAPPSRARSRGATGFSCEET